MKSSRDISPRVGMQVRFCICGLPVERHKVSRRFEATGFCGSDGIAVTSGYAWEGGAYEIEWTPPTDDERRLFMEASRGFSDRDHSCDELCAWLFDVDPYGDDREIAESLALDGADYDNMPDFEELER